MSGAALHTALPWASNLAAAAAALRLRVVGCDRWDAEVNSPAHQSPSLGAIDRDAPAYELKFLLDESQAKEIQRRLGPLLSLDPHANPAANNSYLLTTLYCDTPALDVFHRVGRYQLFKFRLRQYGHSQQVFLERKSKRGKLVRKRRWAIGLEELPRLVQSPAAEGADWQGAWYQRQIARNQFQPVCILRYQRVAYFGSTNEGPIRLTFDREICGALTTAWSLTLPPQTLPLLAGRIVCEFKFRRALPVAFKSVLEAMRLVPCGISKFRHCLTEAWLVSEGAQHHA